MNINIKRGTSLRERGHTIDIPRAPTTGASWWVNGATVSVTWWGPDPVRDDRDRERVCLSMTLEETETLLGMLQDSVDRVRRGQAGVTK